VTATIRPRGVTVLRRLVPWVVSVAILTILIRRAGQPAIYEAARNARLFLLGAVTVICTAGMFLLDALALSRVVSWFNCRASPREMAPVKAAAYLINVINYNAGSGAIAFWLRQCKGVPFLEGASSLLFLNVVDAMVLVGFMAVALPVLDPPLCTGVLAAVCIAALGFTGNLLYWRRGIDFILLGRLRGWPIFKSFREASLGHYLRLAIIRVPFDFLFMANFWLGLRFFGVEVPVMIAAAYIPVVLFVGVVPITVSGLGTVQAATVFLFRAYATEARLLTFSLVLTLALTAVRAAFGVPVFHRVSRDVMLGRKEA
jgi:hypothetical protein